MTMIGKISRPPERLLLELRKLATAPDVLQRILLCLRLFSAASRRQLVISQSTTDSKANENCARFILNSARFLAMVHELTLAPPVDGCTICSVTVVYPRPMISKRLVGIRPAPFRGRGALGILPGWPRVQMSEEYAQLLARVVAGTCTTGKRTQHGSPDSWSGMITDAREGPAGRAGVAERFAYR